MNLWMIELDLDSTNDWEPVQELWFSGRINGSEDMTPRSLEECSEVAVRIRTGWFSYVEGTMRMRDIESGEIVPFEIFT